MAHLSIFPQLIKLCIYVQYTYFFLFACVYINALLNDNKKKQRHVIFNNNKYLLVIPGHIFSATLLTGNNIQFFSPFFMTCQGYIFD